MFSLVSWLKESILGLFGLAYKNGKILFLGLDNAGKTTLLHMLKTDRIKQSAPTLHPNHEELIIGQIKFRTFDLGGHETARFIWRDYFAAVDGIVFLVDAADRSRFDEVKEEVQRLLSEPGLREVPFVVLGNKIDIPTAASEDELRRTLELPDPATHKRDWTNGKRHDGDRPIEVYMCSVVKQMGYADAFQWLAKFLN